MSQMTGDRLDFQHGVQTEPLTERDIQLIHRLLSDPASFPREFKNWVTTHSSDTVDIAKTQVHGLVSSSGQLVIGGASMEVMGGVLCGCCLPFAGVLAPDGWVLCDGRELLRADYDKLFELLGTVWGTPTAGDKFKVPDLRGRTPYGVDGNVAFADSDGKASGLRGPKHHHRLTANKTFAASGYNTLGGGTSYGGGHQHPISLGGHAARSDINHFQAAEYPSGGINTGYGGDHDHGVSVGGTVNVTGSVAIDDNTTGASSMRDEPGWVGLNWIMGSGLTP